MHGAGEKNSGEQLSNGGAAEGFRRQKWITSGYRTFVTERVSERGQGREGSRGVELGKG